MTVSPSTLTLSIESGAGISHIVVEVVVNGIRFSPTKEAGANFSLPRSSGGPLRKLKYARLQTPAQGPGSSNRDIPTTTPMPNALIRAFRITQILKKPVRTDSKAYAGRYPMYYRTRLAMARGVEDRIPVSTIEFTQKWHRAPRDTRRIGVTGLHPFIFANARVLSHRATSRHPPCGPHEVSD